MAKEQFSDNKYACACGGTVTVYVSDEITNMGTIYKTDGAEGTQIEFTAKCANKHCNFLLAVQNMDGRPYPCMVMFLPLASTKPEVDTSRIITLGNEKLNKLN